MNWLRLLALVVTDRTPTFVSIACPGLAPAEPKVPLAIVIVADAAAMSTAESALKTLPIPTVSNEIEPPPAARFKSSRPFASRMNWFPLPALVSTFRFVTFVSIAFPADVSFAPNPPSVTVTVTVPATMSILESELRMLPVAAVSKSIEALPAFKLRSASPFDSRMNWLPLPEDVFTVKSDTLVSIAAPAAVLAAPKVPLKTVIVAAVAMMSTAESLLSTFPLPTVASVTLPVPASSSISLKALASRRNWLPLFAVEFVVKVSTLTTSDWEEDPMPSPAFTVNKLVVTLVPETDTCVTLPRSESEPAPSRSASSITAWPMAPVVVIDPAVPEPIRMSSPASNRNVLLVDALSVTTAPLLIVKSSLSEVLLPAV